MGLFERLRDMRAGLADMVASDQAALPEHAPFVHRHEHNAMGPILDVLALFAAAEGLGDLGAAYEALHRLDASQADTTGKVD